MPHFRWSQTLFVWYLRGMSPKRHKSPDSGGPVCCLNAWYVAGDVNLIRQCKKLETAVGEWEHCQEQLFIKVINLGDFPCSQARDSLFPSGHRQPLASQTRRSFCYRARHRNIPAAFWSCFTILKHLFLLPPKLPVAILEQRVRLYRGWQQTLGHAILRAGEEAIDTVKGGANWGLQELCCLFSS